MGTGRCVGIPELAVLISAAAVEATVMAASAVELVPVASGVEAPATFEATAASSDAADIEYIEAGEATPIIIDVAVGVSASILTGEGVYVPSGMDALAGIWSVVV